MSVYILFSFGLLRSCHLLIIFGFYFCNWVLFRPAIFLLYYRVTGLLVCFLVSTFLNLCLICDAILTPFLIGYGFFGSWFFIQYLRWAIYLSVCLLVLTYTPLWLYLDLMDSRNSQSAILSNNVTGHGVSKRLKIKVPRFDNSELIKGYARTMIGRCMNPEQQDVKNMLYMLPRIWKMEDRVVGTNIGMGSFRFRFENEEDIVEVQKMEPFHLDYWMLSLVRWSPSTEKNYPSAI